MPITARISSLLLAVSLGLAQTGCHSHRPPESFEAGGTSGKVAVIGSDLVVLDLPTVDISHGNILISGTVHRRPGVTGELPGRVDIEFLDPDGEYLDGLPALLTPRAVPVDPSASATYATSYGFIPPRGSTVRVHFVDRDTMIREDLEGGINGYGTGGKTGHGGAGGAHHAAVNTGGFGSGFGNMGTGFGNMGGGGGGHY
jgi:hypothetical protein